MKKEKQRTSKTTLFKSKYNGGGINYPSEKDDWNIFEEDNPTIVLNVFIICQRNENITCLRFKT